MPSSSGTYALFLNLPRAKDLRIGLFGAFQFPAGDYVYVGSAFGPGGLRARIARHLRMDKRAHWHIDYFRAGAQVRGVAFVAAPRALECEWSRALGACKGAYIPAIKFGAMDCYEKCAAHFFAFPRGITESVLHELREKADASFVIDELN